MIDLYTLQKSSSHIRETLYELGLAQCRLFLSANLFAEPEYIKGAAPHALNKWQGIGLYTNGRVWVDLSKTTVPRANKGPVWSWPGYKVDRTAAGVVAHETGHYVSDQLKVNRSVNAQRWLDILNVEKPLTGYEPTPEESFAETMRVYILNPHLLMCGRPMRHRFIQHTLRLSPATQSMFGVVLNGAPAHILNAAAKFANQELT